MMKNQPGLFGQESKSSSGRGIYWIDRWKIFTAGVTTLLVSIGWAFGAGMKLNAFESTSNLVRKHEEVIAKLSTNGVGFHEAVTRIEKLEDLAIETYQVRLKYVSLIESQAITLTAIEKRLSRIEDNLYRKTR